MTVPLPTQGATSWYPWASQVHTAITQPTKPPTLPPNTVVIYGDSITANAGPLTSGTAVSMSVAGYWTWASRLLGHRLHMLKNAGVSGQTSTQILARFTADVAAYSPGYVVVLAGRNDGTLGAAGTEANLKSIYDKCAGIGAVVIACTLPPGNSPATGQRAADNQINAWIKRQAQVRSGFIVVDWTKAVSDVSGNFAANASDDGTHPNGLGARRMGQVMAATLDPLIPKLDRLVDTNDDAANLTANPMMFGAQSADINNGGTGSLATSWQSGTVGSGVTYSISQAAGTDLPGLNWQEINVTVPGTGGAQIYQYTESVSSTKTTAAIGDGNLYIASCEYQIVSLSNPKYVGGYGPGPSLKVSCSDSSFSGTASALDAAPNATDVYPLDGVLTESGVLRTPPIQIPAGTAHVQVAITFTAQGTLRVRRAGLRRLLTSTDV